VSIGLAEFTEAGRDGRELYAAADAALYEAKRQGRDRVVAANTTTFDANNAPALGVS
jgi:PleD family two-component response regulator